MEVTLKKFHTIRDAASEDSPFPVNFFPIVGEGSQRQRRLQNVEKNSYIDITTDDLIFQYSIENSFEEAFDWIVHKCVPFFVDKILKPNKVTDYMRLGIIFGHKLRTPGFLNEVAADVTSSQLSNPETLMLRISKKTIVNEALIKKHVNDYQNIIFTVDRQGQDQISVDVDIQHYFDPFPKTLDEYPYKDFFIDAKKVLISTYHPLIRDKFLTRPGAIK